MKKQVLIAFSVLIALLMVGTAFAVPTSEWVVKRPTRENILAMKWANKHMGARTMSVIPEEVAAATEEGANLSAMPATQEQNVTEEVGNVTETIAPVTEENATGAVETTMTPTPGAAKTVLPASETYLSNEVPVSSTATRFNNMPWYSIKSNEAVVQQGSTWNSRYIFVKRGVSKEVVNQTFEQLQKPVVGTYVPRQQATGVAEKQVG